MKHCGIAVILDRLCAAAMKTGTLADDRIAEHADWAEYLQKRYVFDRDNVDEVLKEEIGNVFMQVLEHAGVYRRTA